MRDVERALSGMLAERASRILPPAGHREATMRRSRRRRLANAAVSGVVSVAVVAGGIGVARSLDPAPARPASPAKSGETTATAGEYGFWSRAGAYPFVAEGFFRASKWQLRAATVTLLPQRSDVRLTLQVRQRGRTYATSSRVFRDLRDGLYTAYEYGGHLFGGNVALVFGAASPRTDVVEVRLNDGRRIEAHVYEGYGTRTSMYADFYVAFLPTGASGMVIASDAHGNEIDADVIPRR